MKQKLFLLLLIPILVPVFAEPLYSPTWGFNMDLPIGYEFADGNGRDNFSFEGPDEACFIIRVYNGTFKTIKDLVDDVNRRLGNQGDMSFFQYRERQAALLQLAFGDNTGWGLCVELDAKAGGPAPMLLALAYGPEKKDELNLLHMSALDSIALCEEDRYYPGPIMEYGFPRGEQQRTALAMPGIYALIYENDAEAAQILIEREFAVLRRSLFSEEWQEAWIRYYRAIYRDSWDRISDAVFQLERNWNVDIENSRTEGMNKNDEERIFAQKALTWIQSFKYERNFEGSDFINLVTAVTEGRGDCDSRVVLWAIILWHADIRSAIMVSRNHSHAMGLADIEGAGARFETGGTKWLVAETTAQVDIGLIAEDVSDIESWLGVIFQ